MNENKQSNIEVSEQEQTEEKVPLVLDEQQSQEQPVGAKSLFVDEAEAYKGNQQLSKTARLTSVATEIANSVLQEVNADYEANEPKLEASMQSHDAMDDLINEFTNLGNVDVDFLETVEDEEIDKMIRSQQSKRSRAKSKAMTRENYLTMMVGAISENLLRIAGDKPKSSGGASMGSIGYTDEDLQQLAEFPEDLKKAIRNVQSKKSIMKSKADFDPSSSRWQQLLQTEQQLKAVRDKHASQASKEAQEALDRQQKLNEMLKDANVGDDPAKAAEMLESIKSMLASN